MSRGRRLFVSVLRAASVSMAVVCAAVCGSADARASAYVYRSVVDTSGPIATFNHPSINNSGAIAFRATMDDGSEDVLRVDGTTVTTIASSRDGYSQQDFLPVIDGAGNVTFVASRPGDRFSSLFRGNGGAAELLVGTSGRLVSAGFPRVNDGGDVAFVGSLDTGGSGVFVRRRDGMLETVALGDANEHFATVGAPAISNSGRVAFPATPGTGGNGVYVTGPGGITTVAFDPGIDPYFSDVSVNDAGDVLFTNQGGTDAAATKIFLGRPDGARRVTTLVDSAAGPFANVYSMAMNNAGDFVFRGILDSRQTEGIFSGPDPVADRVLMPGDTLFGSTVQFVMAHRAINDRGEVPFSYQLADGRIGLGIATPVPEPAVAGGLLLLGMAALATSRRSRARRNPGAGYFC